MIKVYVVTRYARIVKGLGSEGFIIEIMGVWRDRAKAQELCNDYHRNVVKNHISPYDHFMDCTEVDIPDDAMHVYAVYGDALDSAAYFADPKLAMTECESRSVGSYIQRCRVDSFAQYAQ